jgi:predicted transcriptional regulator
MQSDTAMTLRLYHGTTKRLQESAARNHRTLTAEIRFALERYLEDTAKVSPPDADAPATDFEMPDFDE